MCSQCYELGGLGKDLEDAGVSSVEQVRVTVLRFHCDIGAVDQDSGGHVFLCEGLKVCEFYSAE